MRKSSMETRIDFSLVFPSFYHYSTYSSRTNSHKLWTITYVCLLTSTFTIFRIRRKWDYLELHANIEFDLSLTYTGKGSWISSALAAMWSVLYSLRACYIVVLTNGARTSFFFELLLTKGRLINRTLCKVTSIDV